MTLNTLITEMKDALCRLREQEKDYGYAPSFRSFLSRKEADYEEFLRIVVGRFGRNAFVPEVVSDLKAIMYRCNGDEKLQYRKFLGMTQRPTGYFQMTKELKKTLGIQ